MQAVAPANQRLSHSRNIVISPSRAYVPECFFFLVVCLITHNIIDSDI